MAPWLAAAGAFVVSLDSMMNIAFPAIATAFAVPPEAIQWVIICYTGVYALTAFAGGAVADLVGHMRVFRAGVALMALALLGGGVAPSFGWLLAARVVQGVAGGLIYGTAPGMVTLASSPDHRGRALGTLNAGIALALAVGPLSAGFLVDLFDWRAVLFTRVPFALVVLAAALALDVPSRHVATRRLVALADLRRRPIPGACILAFLAWAGIFSIWLLVPFYLVERRGFGAGIGGVIFTLTPIGTTLAAPFAGRVADRIGAAAPMIVGLVLEAAGLGAIALADAGTPTLLVALALFAAGLGLGIFQVPMMTLVMGAFPSELQGAAGGLTFLARTLGLVTGVAAFAALFAARRTTAGFDAAFGDAFLLATTMVAVAAALAVLLARRWVAPRGR
ncbi:MAG TPA: MFS transporter [Methylomirabilota bacterium]|nr:MFS transporter [Methylomirabilota bacterium]